MAYTEQHAVLQFGGPTSDGGEEWSCSLRMRGVGAQDIGSESVDNALAAAYLNAIVARWEVSAGFTSAQFRLKYAKYNRVGLDGKYRNSYTARSDLGTYVATANVDAVMPLQICIVSTLRTEAARGLANSGRIFLPAPGIPLSTSDPRLTAAQRDTYAGKIKALLDAINAVEIGQRIGIMSKVREGMSRDVTSVEVGRVLDTMRSRRTSLAEERTGLALAGA